MPLQLIQSWCFSCAKTSGTGQPSRCRKAIFGDAWRGHEQAEAKKRQGTRNDIVETFPPSEPAKSRDKIGERVGVSGKSIDKVAVVCVQAVRERTTTSRLRNGKSGNEQILFR